MKLQLTSPLCSPRILLHTPLWLAYTSSQNNCRQNEHRWCHYDKHKYWSLLLCLACGRQSGYIATFCQKFVEEHCSINPGRLGKQESQTGLNTLFKSSTEAISFDIIRIRICRGEIIMFVSDVSFSPFCTCSAKVAVRSYPGKIAIYSEQGGVSAFYSYLLFTIRKQRLV